MRYINLTVVLLGALLLTGCSTFSKSDNEELLGERFINYQAEKGEISDLVIPPDLTNPKSKSVFDRSAGGVLETAVSKVGSPDISNIKVKRDAHRRWLLVERSPDVVWPQAKRFLQSFGFKIDREDPTIGIIETEFLESDPDVPDASLGVVRSMFSGLLKAKYALPIADKYRVRIEGVNEGQGSEIYLTLTSIEEVSTDNAPIWQSRAKDHDLETEMLLRLMVFLGSDRSRAIEKINNTDNSEKAPVTVTKTNEGYASLVFQNNTDEAWDYLGWALDELSVDIVDSDPLERSYYVNLVRESASGFLWKLVGKGDDTISIQLVVRELEEGRSQVFFNDLGEENEQKTIDFSFTFFEEVANQF